jgi:hypothetical protein
MTMEKSFVGPDVKAALVAKENFVARLRSVDPRLSADFAAFLFDYVAPRRTLQAEYSRLNSEFGEIDECLARAACAGDGFSMKPVHGPRPCR